VAHRIHDVADRGDHELGLLELDVVATLPADDVPAVRHERGELVLDDLPQPLVRFVDARRPEASCMCRERT
jgi:hypothetical protein